MARLNERPRRSRRSSIKSRPATQGTQPAMRCTVLLSLLNFLLPVDRGWNQDGEVIM